MQPLIAPLYDGRTIIEVLAAFIDAQTGKSSHDLVKDYWTRAHGGKVARLDDHRHDRVSRSRAPTASGSTRCTMGS